MKRNILGFVVVLISVIILIGCDKNNNVIKDNDSTKVINDSKEGNKTNSTANEDIELVQESLTLVYNYESIRFYAYSDDIGTLKVSDYGNKVEYIFNCGTTREGILENKNGFNLLRYLPEELNIDTSEIKNKTLGDLVDGQILKFGTVKVAGNGIEIKHEVITEKEEISKIFDSEMQDAVNKIPQLDGVIDKVSFEEYVNNNFQKYIEDDYTFKYDIQYIAYRNVIDELISSKASYTSGGLCLDAHENNLNSSRFKIVFKTTPEIEGYTICINSTEGDKSFDTVSSLIETLYGLLIPSEDIITDTLTAIPDTGYYYYLKMSSNNFELSIGQSQEEIDGI